MTHCMTKVAFMEMRLAGAAMSYLPWKTATSQRLVRFAAGPAL